MTAPVWPRPYWRDGGARAFLQWFVFGDFEPELHVDAQSYRTRGTPAGVEVARYAHPAIKHWIGYPLGGSLGRLFENENRAVFDRASRARECLMLRGDLADPRDLDDLRDLVGTITALADQGGVAVVDPQMLSMWSAADWNARFFADDALVVRRHIAILASEDAAHAMRRHVHTRGLRKFARPDISLRNVPADLVSHAGQLAERLAEFEALGGIVEEGRTIEIEGLGASLVAHHAGSLDDPAFNNTHIELCWPD
ncbi:MAG TPA: hypothetical protein VJ696_00300 [Rhodanobacteraceae bacterium]|nr:hypothetical protein [Rhodanobacteraceae bacterium]